MSKYEKTELEGDLFNTIVGNSRDETSQGKFIFTEDDIWGLIEILIEKYQIKGD